MHNADSWSATKFELHRGRLRASRDKRQVAPGSLLMADLVAAAYAARLPRHARGRLIDLGCGKVPLYGSYRDHVDSVTCVDWGDSYHGNQYLDQECDLTRPLPFADDDFDTIVLSDVLEHIPEPASLWSEMARILRPSGTLIMNVPFCYWIHEKPHDYYRYTEFALQRFAEGAGLEVLELEPLGGALEILADIHGKLLQSLPWVGFPMARVVQEFTGWFVSTGLGRGVSCRTAGRFPFGYIMVARKPGLGSSTA
jgi:SAM-dependent methyltransferase